MPGVSAASAPPVATAAKTAIKARSPRIHFARPTHDLVKAAQGERNVQKKKAGAHALVVINAVPGGGIVSAKPLHCQINITQAPEG